MRAREFAARWSRIAWRVKHGGSVARARVCLQALVDRSGAIPIVAGGVVIAYRMPNGSTACEKQRFRDHRAAECELARIRQQSSHAHIPVRAYRCDLCGGWHLTSKPVAFHE